MTLSEMSSLAGIVASIGVLVTFIYLAIQVRQSTLAIRLDTAHSVTDELQAMFSLLASNEDLAEVFVAAAKSGELSAVDRLRYNAFTSNLVRVYENAFLQNREKVIDEAHWAGLTRMMIDVSKLPAFPEYWADRAHWFSEAFQAHMNTAIIPAVAKSGINLPGQGPRTQLAGASPVVGY